MNIDWSSAPEGATHYCPETEDVMAVWFKPSGSKWLFALDQTHIREWRDFLDDFPGEMPIVERPTPWDGNGLPPVGTVCEVLNNTLDRPEWERCTILFMGKFKTVYESESCHERVADVSEDWMISFRPIRTPEQIAAEQERSSIKEMADIISRKIADSQAAQALWDAGFRKVEGGAQ